MYEVSFLGQQMVENTSVTLLKRIQNPADEDAWSRFDAVYRSFIAGFLASRKVDEHVCEDICQSVMKQVYEAMTDGRFEHNGRSGAFLNWLRQVVVSQLGVYHRKARRNEQRLPAGLEENLSKEDSRLVQLWDLEHNQATLRLVLALLRDHTPPDSLEIFRRTFVDGADADQVAEEFGRTKNAVIVVKCKVLKKARELAAELID